MAAGNKAQEPAKPTREDGREWTNAMESAAQLRAKGMSWPAVAEQLGLATDTVNKYPSRYPPFETKDDRNPGLVEYYRERLLDARFREHWGAGEIEALEAVRAQFEGKSAQAERVADRLDAGDFKGDEERQRLQSKLSTLSRAVVQAAREYNNMTGRTSYRNEKGKLKAQEDMSGQPGDILRHEGSLDHTHHWQPDEDAATEIADVLNDIGAIDSAADGAATEGAQDQE